MSIQCKVYDSGDHTALIWLPPDGSASTIAAVSPFPSSEPLRTSNWDEHASDWTDELTVTSGCTPHTSAYFNKGIVASQRVSRDPAKEAQGTSHPPSLACLIKKEGDPLRDALGGLLKNEILKLLADAEGGQFYAALHELNDPEQSAGSHERRCARRARQRFLQEKR